MTWAKKTYKFSKNGTYFSTSTNLLYIPLTGSDSEVTDPTSSLANLVPSNSGRLNSIDFRNTGFAGSTIITLYDNNVGGVIGTKTFNLAISNTVYHVDFTTGLDSGVNYFDGAGMIAIGVNTTASGGNVRYTANFEIDL